MSDFHIPDEINTNNPKEFVSYCVALGMQEHILPPKFKMNTEAYKIVEQALLSIWDHETSDHMIQVVIFFITGYAVGSGQIGAKQ